MRRVGLTAFRAEVERIGHPVVVVKHTGRSVRVLGVWQPAAPPPGPPDPVTVAVVEVVGEIRAPLVRAIRALYRAGELRPTELVSAAGQRPGSTYALTAALTPWVTRRAVSGGHYRQTVVELSEPTRAAIAARLEEMRHG